MCMTMFMFLMHDIVVLSTCCDAMYGISLYIVVLLYMHRVGFNDNFMKVLIDMDEVVYVALYMYEVNC